MNTSRLLSVEDVNRLTGVRESMILRWEENGRFAPTMRFGPRRIPLIATDQLLVLRALLEESRSDR